MNQEQDSVERAKRMVGVFVIGLVLLCICIMEVMVCYYQHHPATPAPVTVIDSPVLGAR